jgi:hypothetical protein
MAKCVGCQSALVAGQTALLPCLHTVCVGCATSAVRDTRHLTCPLPVCRARVPGVATVDDVARLLPHLLREAELRTQFRQRCGACEDDVAAEDAAAEVLCTSCDPPQPLCNPHAGMHRRRAATRAHTLQPLVETAVSTPSTPDDAAGGAETTPIFTVLPDGGGLALACRVHARKPVEVWCASCRRGVCLACTQTEHRLPKHETTLLDAKVRAALTAELTQGRANLLQRQEETTRRAALTRTHMATVTTRTAALKASVDEQVAVLYTLLDARAAALRQQIEAQGAADLAPLTALADTLASQLAVAEAPLALLDELLATSAPLSVLAAMAGPVQHRVSQLATLPLTTPATPPSLDLVLGGAVRRAIGEMGSLLRRHGDPAQSRLVGAGISGASRGVQVEVKLITNNGDGQPLTTGGERVQLRLIPEGPGGGDGGGSDGAKEGEDIVTASTDPDHDALAGSPARRADGAATPTNGQQPAADDDNDNDNEEDDDDEHGDEAKDEAGGEAQGDAFADGVQDASGSTSGRGRPPAPRGHASVTDLGNGQYLLRYRLNVAGAYKLHVLLNGLDVAGSPVRVHVTSFRDLTAIGVPKVLVPMTEDVTLCFAAEVPPGAPCAGDLLVTENAGHTVRLLSPDPRRGKAFGSGVLQSPYGIAIASDGQTALVANGGLGRLDRFALPDGTFAGMAVEGLAVPVGVLALTTSAGQASVVVSCSGDHTVRRYTLGRGCPPTLVWMTGTADRPGRGTNAFTNPAGLALSHDRRTVYVADYSNQRIVALAASDGKWLRAWGEGGSGPAQLSGPMALAVTPDDAHVLVVDQGNHRVVAYKADTGALVHAWGGKGLAPGQFASPCGICIQPGTGAIVVVDRFNKRLQFF